MGCPVCFGEPGPKRLSSVSYPEVGHSLIGTRIGLKSTSPMGKLSVGEGWGGIPCHLLWLCHRLSTEGTRPYLARVTGLYFLPSQIPVPLSTQSSWAVLESGLVARRLQEQGLSIDTPIARGSRASPIKVWDLGQVQEVQGAQSPLESVLPAESRPSAHVIWAQCCLCLFLLSSLCPLFSVLLLPFFLSARGQRASSSLTRNVCVSKVPRPLPHPCCGLGDHAVFLTAASVFSHPLRPLLAVSIEDIRDVRMGHRTEGLEKFARDVPEERCFSIVFKDQRNTLDLIAPSPQEAQHWVQGLRKIIHHSGTMDQRQKLQQYPVAVGVGPACGCWRWATGVRVRRPLGLSQQDSRLVETKEMIFPLEGGLIAKVRMLSGVGFRRGLGFADSCLFTGQGEASRRSPQIMSLCPEKQHFVSKV